MTFQNIPGTNTKPGSESASGKIIMQNTASIEFYGVMHSTPFRSSLCAVFSIALEILKKRVAVGYQAILMIILTAGLFACSDSGGSGDSRHSGDLRYSGNQNIANKIVSGAGNNHVTFGNTPGHFPLASNGEPVPLFISDDDHPGVVRALRDLQSDFERVTHTLPEFHTGVLPDSPRLVLAGTIGHNTHIDQLIDSGKLDVSDIAGRWETFSLQVVKNPFPGTDEALVIAGSDKRGTIYGIYELSRLIGVSPWFWWADVPVPHQTDLYISPEPWSLGEPAVQYRGIFINNENPSLLGWVNHTFGGFNHDFYEQVFELILRLRGNYLWPAMWGKAFHDDDPMNPELADEYGVVIGYTHHEPMNRAHVEWARYGEGAWNYETNTTRLREFWREGIESMKNYEASVTLGMRGDGDEPMTDEANVELLERIVRDQRDIINEYAQQDTDNILQIWALYKEVQEYYEMGMQVPDDVMILLANDNWGNVRLLPDPETSHERQGGWGMYYHFDYVGGPRNYKWINTIQISRIWEQMHLTYQHGVDKLWLVNVGDIKPMEYPISFFLDFAWNPDAMTAEHMDNYPRFWARQQFGADFAEEIGYLLTEYTRFNSRRKPELLNADTYSLIHFREAERVVADYNELTRQAKELHERMPDEYRDAYFQLVLYPIEASANINELYLHAAKNRLYAEQGRAQTSIMAGKAQENFNYNDEMDRIYHEDIADGKWRHMMDQTRIGYTYWQQPEVNAMPEVHEIELPDNAVMGVAIEGSERWWPGSGNDNSPDASVDTGTGAGTGTGSDYGTGPDAVSISGSGSETAAVLPVIDRFHHQSPYIEIFNRGTQPFHFRIETGETWLSASTDTGTIDTQQRIYLQVDWERAPAGKHRIPVSIFGAEPEPVMVYADVFIPDMENDSSPAGFIESNGYVSIEAPNYTRNISNGDVGWKHIPQLGRTHSAMAPSPVLAASRDPSNANTPRLEYDLHLFSSGEVRVKLYLAPTKNYSKNYRNPDGIRLAVSFNDEDPVTINMHEEMKGGFINNVWYRWVADNINIVSSSHVLDRPGDHTLKVWMVDTGVVLQKIVVETGEVGRTYLGPPESVRIQ